MNEREASDKMKQRCQEHMVTSVCVRSLLLLSSWNSLKLKASSPQFPIAPNLNGEGRKDPLCLAWREFANFYFSNLFLEET